MRAPGLLTAALAAAMALAAPALAATPSFPPLTGRVVDAAHVLTPAVVSEITRRSADLEAKTGRQLVVATVPSLGGDDIQDYGYQLGRAWKIGRAGKNDGAVLIVAPAEHKVGVEVGYGLEPVLTDALSSVIIQTRILPKFKAGDIPGGTQAGADAIADQLAMPDDQAKAQVADAQAQPAPQPERHGSHGIPGFVILLILFFVFSGVFRRRGRYGGGGGGLGWLPWVLLGAMNSRGGRDDDWGGGGGGGFGGFGGGGGGFSGGGGSFGGGGASGSW